jgi:hypothetical protein
VTAEQLSAALTPALARELNSSTISRTTAEKELEMKKDYEKLRYLADRENNEEIKKLTEKFAEVSSKAGALNEAVSTEDKMIIGKYTNSRYDILRQAQAFADLLEKEKEVMDELETIEDKESEEYKSKKAELDSYRAKKAELEESFNKSKAGHPDLANQTILEVAEAIRNKTIDGKVLAAEMRKQGVNYNKGIDAQTEDMRREGSIEQLLKENAEFLNPQGELVRALEKLASGQTVGLDIETQRKFDVLIYTLKDWLRSSRHPNHNAAIENVLKLLVKNGKQQIAYVDANGEQKQINADNVDEVISRISQMSGKEKSNLVQALYRHPAVGGSPAQHVQRF